MILQFGAGNFLRGFVDLFAAQLNRDPATAVGPVVVVQSTGIERAESLNRAGGKYHVAVQGYRDGRIIDETELSDSITHALHAGTQWDAVLAAAADPTLRMIVSNTTEAGFALADESPPDTGAPHSFPAKLLAVLLARHRADLPPPAIVPCELIEQNGTRLRELVLEQAARWQIDSPAREWLREGCQWVNNLVDRIVPGAPENHPLLGSDPLLIAAEPFALWAIETTAPFAFHHPAVVTAADISPYYLRKVRILNGLHSAMVGKALPLGITTVRECLEHPVVAPWLERLLNEEIAPVLEGRVEDPLGFAAITLDRFRNPFLKHQLSAIALNHETKLRVRLLPTYQEYREKFGKTPPLLSELVGSI
jgi:tagaturonate reductase